MPSLYSNEDFLNKLLEKDRSDLIPLDTYVNANTPIRFQCVNQNCNHIWLTKPVNVLSGKGSCPECRRRELSESHKISKEEYERRLYKIRPNLSILGDFNGTKYPVDLICDKGHIWHVPKAQIAINPGGDNRGCPYCNHLLLDKEENSLFVIRPDLLKYFKNPEEAKTISPRSMKKVELICPNCGHIKEMTVDNLSTKGFSCKYCKTDGISYPNKFLRGLLKQLNTVWDIEVSYDWSKKYKYDGMIEINDKKYLIEMQGLQHYKNTSFCNFEHQKKRDVEKRQLALNNNFVFIEIDCKISDFNYIRQNILQSELSQIIDFSVVNWNLVYEEIGSNYVKQASDLFNQGFKIIEISKKLNLNRHTIRKYLLDASAIGWCQYK